MLETHVSHEEHTTLLLIFHCVAPLPVDELVRSEVRLKHWPAEWRHPLNRFMSDSRNHVGARHQPVLVINRHTVHQRKRRHHVIHSSLETRMRGLFLGFSESLVTLLWCLVTFSRPANDPLMLGGSLSPQKGKISFNPIPFLTTAQSTGMLFNS